MLKLEARITKVLFILFFLYKFRVMTQTSSLQIGALLRAGQQQIPQSKYAQLLAVIEDMGKDIRPTYAGSKSSAERLKRGIVHARILVRECLLETERSARQ